MRVTDITTSRINAYVDKRLNEGVTNATINRELAALKRMLKLGARHEPPKAALVPFIEMLKEDNVRQGFFEDIEFEDFRNRGEEARTQKGQEAFFLLYPSL